MNRNEGTEREEERGNIKYEKGGKEGEGQEERERERGERTQKYQIATTLHKHLPV